MLKPHGYATWTDPERPVVERDTVACCHCGAAIVVKPGTGATVYLIWSPGAQRWIEEAGAGCRLCLAAVCLRCEADGRCLPLERRLEQVERRR
jgi:hypothetical protein